MSYQIPSALEISNKAKEGSASLKALHGFLKTKTSMEVDQLFAKHLDKIQQLWIVQPVATVAKCWKRVFLKMR